MMELIGHSHETGRAGKPDKFETILASHIGALLLSYDSNARFDLRVAGGWDMERDRPLVKLSGEMTDAILREPSLMTNIQRLVEDEYNHVHKTGLLPSCQFGFKGQAAPLATNGFAGDSGNPIAVAYTGTPTFLPWERFLAVDFRDTIDAIYQSNDPFFPPLKADGKIGIDALYNGVGLSSLGYLIFAIEHQKESDLPHLRSAVRDLVRDRLSALAREYGTSFGDPLIITNGRGAWTAGGWKIDEGTREAKPYEDAFGSYGCVEDSLFGEDPSKPGLTGTIAARNAAVQLVASGRAEFARVRLTYVIGTNDVDVNVTTQGTGKEDQTTLERWVRDNCPLHVGDVIEQFSLRDPFLFDTYARIGDAFHSPEYAWNQRNV